MVNWHSGALNGCRSESGFKSRTPRFQCQVAEDRTLFETVAYHSVKTSCSVPKVEVSVFSETAPNLFAKRALSTARI